MNKDKQDPLRGQDAMQEGAAKEFSPFLPDGWKWENKVGYMCVYYKAKVCGGIAYLSPLMEPEQWHLNGLLHPSEGGGFQRHTPGDPMPCDGEVGIDVRIEGIPYRFQQAGAGALKFHWGKGGGIIGFRPHLPTQDAKAPESEKQMDTDERRSEKMEVSRVEWWPVYVPKDPLSMNWDMADMLLFREYEAALKQFDEVQELLKQKYKKQVQE